MASGSLISFFCSPSFMPHGHCYQWNVGILTLEVLGNAVIALAYYSIPVALLMLVRRRPDIPHPRLFFMFSLFITFCGTGHLIDLLTIWHPIYWLKAYWNAATALISIVTTIMLTPLLPRLIRGGTIEEALQRRMIAQLEAQRDELAQANRHLGESNARLEEQMVLMQRAGALLAEREARVRELRGEVARLRQAEVEQGS